MSADEFEPRTIGLEVYTNDQPDSPDPGVMLVGFASRTLTPQEARGLARRLLDAADHLERPHGVADQTPWRVTRDEDGDPHTVCPTCEAQDTIVEVDETARWNTLNLLSADGLAATALTGDYFDWKFSNWCCSACGDDSLEAPDGFEILDWS